MIDYCAEHGIFLDYTLTDTPEMNPVAERFNRTVVEKARTLLLQANLPEVFWGDAVLTATYLYNRSFHSSIGRTPYEALLSTAPILSKLRVYWLSCAQLHSSGSTQENSK